MSHTHVPQHGTIRFEDLGEPVQRLLRSLDGGYAQADMDLLVYVSVKDMVKIYGEMSIDRRAEEIWAELRAELQNRKTKDERRAAELKRQQDELDAAMHAQKEDHKRQEEADAAAQATREDARRKRKEAKRKARQDPAQQQQQDDSRDVAEEEAQRLEEEERRRQEERRRRRAARERELQTEQEELQKQHAVAESQQRRRQNDDWAEYVAAHPLAFRPAKTEITQKPKEHTLNGPPATSANVLKRTYTPKCPQCDARFSSPPPNWVCPFCKRQYRKTIWVWQPDAATKVCMVCDNAVSRFARHHCRCCGRVICNQCGESQAVIPHLGFTTPVTICDECGALTQQNATLHR